MHRPGGSARPGHLPWDHVELHEPRHRGNQTGLLVGHADERRVDEGLSLERVLFVPGDGGDRHPRPPGLLHRVVVAQAVGAVAFALAYRFLQSKQPAPAVV
jgi:hypothetical protein